MIDRATIDRIMGAANIVEVVSDFVNLRRSGANYKGLCPFHDDKTPSFMVSPAKNICHCFACGKGGNAVNFIMEHEQMTYPDALRYLAKKYSIDIVEKDLTEDERKEASNRESMYIVNEWARGYFQNVLENDADGQAIGMQYFRSRGIRDDIVKKFSLGYALPQRDALSKEALKKGYQREFLIMTGLCYEKDNGDLVDRYAGRVIFPWMNVSGKVSAFGGRLLDSRTKGVQQKYVNSPESDIFHKDRELYGLFQAKRAITKEDSVYMVEGYTDVIAMHQCGIENVVANSGTALSVHQIKLLRRFTQNITLLYDGDEAGIHAAMRGTDMLLAEGMNIKVLLLPDGDDPDSYAKKHGAEALVKYIESNKDDFIQFKTQLLLQGVTDPIKRSEAIQSIVKSISLIPNTITRDTYLHECASRLEMNERTLISAMNRFIRDEKKRRDVERAATQARTDTTAQARTDSAGQASSPERQTKVSKTLTQDVETMLIQLVIRYGEEVIFDDLEDEDGLPITMSVAQYIDYDMSQDGLEFRNPLYNTILQEAVQHNGDYDFRSVTYFTRHPDIKISSLATALSIDHYKVSKRLEMGHDKDSLCRKVQHLILDFRKEIVEQQLDSIKMRLKQTQDSEEVKAIMVELSNVMELRNILAAKVGRA